MHRRGARLLAAAAVAGSLALGGCTAPVAEPADASTAPTSSPVPTNAHVVPPVVTYGTVQDPQIGVAYEYHFYVHCGLRQAVFGGREWVVRRRVGTPPVTDPSQYVTGAMTLVSPGLARFEWPGGSADLVPPDAPLPGCA